ncbi:hypothetical protein SERLA73DRAFT_178822 [Serpula lacrymans var. lacrymans S7.3]|uniref:DUF6534 domain-containing protein n=1 Tax=Serpula lacrymans var. lacrymans (strain S7.3) TaxID=936435 RepID=F8PSZ6_SERL3|nr:hypothetical protein SERLA73DRAFT_178822 [Serpula lacrymans var. lacrymans S7.3]
MSSCTPPNWSSFSPDTPIALGYTFSFGLFGILIVQTFIYYTRFTNDPRWLKCLVWLIFLMECLGSAFTLYAFWLGASVHCLSCAIDGGYYIKPDCEMVLFSVWYLVSLFVLTGLISSSVHAFYCWRIWVIGRSLIVPIVVMLLSITQSFVAIYGAFRGLMGGTPSNNIDYIWLAGSCLCDLLITIQTTRLLLLQKSGSGISKTKSILVKLVKLTIETGMVTVAATLLELLFAVVLYRWTHIAHLIVFFSLSKLYANCMLANLNSRLLMAKDSEQDHVSSIHFDGHTRRTATLVLT